jgi:hypothetical protein
MITKGVLPQICCTPIWHLILDGRKTPNTEKKEKKTFNRAEEFSKEQTTQ